MTAISALSPLRRAELDNARVTAVAIFIPYTKLTEKSLDGFNAGSTFDRHLFLAFLTAKTALFGLERAVSGVEEPSGLTAKMNSA